MNNCMPSADTFYWNVSNFSTIDNFLSEKNIEDTSTNTVKGIIGLFVWKEDQLQEYLDTKLECANDDDRMQLWMLNAALFEHKNIINNSQDNIQQLRWNIRSNIESINNNNNISVIRWNIIINQIVQDWKSRADLGFVKFDVPKFKKTKVNVELNTILEQKIWDGKISLKFWYKDWYEPKVIDLNYEETSTHITFYYDKNENGDLDRYESRKSKTILKQAMRNQHDSYYYTTNINLRDLWIPWVKKWIITLKIQKTD